MERLVQPELLDGLDSTNPLAIGSRKDLQRLNAVMNSAGNLRRALQACTNDFSTTSYPIQVLEIGAGDGTLFLKLARQWRNAGLRGSVTLLDIAPSVSKNTLHQLEMLGWSATVVQANVFDYLSRDKSRFEIVFANLFLHHFEAGTLVELLRLIAANTRFFAACEPRRSPFALLASKLVGLLGCNRVTRHDAVVSVQAGFKTGELAALWPKATAWQLRENSAGLFSHCFIAQLNA